MVASWDPVVDAFGNLNAGVNVVLIDSKVRDSTTGALCAMLMVCKGMSRVVFMPSAGVADAAVVGAVIGIVIAATGVGGTGNVISTLTVA